MTEAETIKFNEWFDNWDGERCRGWDRVSREDAQEIWEASLNEIKGQMIKVFIPGLGKE